ncbi:MAG: hypothetical protein JNL50_08500 [Phycisphaerae bacterium]|nr:hypothetical protein [Phycisphaerae bacterium]
MLMSFQTSFAFYERVKRIVGEQTGFECIRADDIPGGGMDLRKKIHDAVDNSVFVIADISEPRPNIFYEVGYAVARQKPVLLLLREGSQVPSDLSGTEYVPYQESRERMLIFEAALRQQLAQHKDAGLSLRRTMVVPPDPQPSIILVNPKMPLPDSRFRGHPAERRTYGDYLGVMGVTGVFATVYGEYCIPDLLTASQASDGIVSEDANLFLIGSPKVNAFTAGMLERIQNGQDPRWHFEACPGEEKTQDAGYRLCGALRTGGFLTPCPKPGAEVTEDWGLLVRGPHPQHPKRQVLILAGPRSIGTGAACLAATRSELVSEIAKKLHGLADLTTRDRAIWALVHGKTSEDGHLDAANVTVQDAGVFPLPRTFGS